MTRKPYSGRDAAGENGPDGRPAQWFRPRRDRCFDKSSAGLTVFLLYEQSSTCLKGRQARKSSSFKGVSPFGLTATGQLPETDHAMEQGEHAGRDGHGRVSEKDQLNGPVANGTNLLRWSRRTVNYTRTRQMTLGDLLLENRIILLEGRFTTRWPTRS